MTLSLVVLIRTYRPYISFIGITSWLVYRIARALGTSDWTNDATILTHVLNFVDSWKALVWDNLVNYQTWGRFLDPVVSFFFQLLHDVFGILIIVGIHRITYCLYHFSWAECRMYAEEEIFEWAKQNIPAVSNYLRKETDRMTPSMEKSFCRDAFQNDKQLALPEKGRDRAKVLQQLTDYASKEHSNWKTGKVSGTVYTDDDDHIQLMNNVYGLYSVANNLHPGIWPKLNQCENELIAMTSSMMHGTGIGCVTSGGTESIMLAIKAHLVYYGKRRKIVYPELVCGTTVHAAVDKACEVFGIRKVCIDCSDRTSSCTLNPQKVKRAITSNTIMIVASAPNYPQGTIDPIEALGALAVHYDIGLHVDTCLGGFVLPFAPERFPLFDFQVPGVTSMSADTHKFGYAPKGTSVVLYRTKELRHAQYFSYARWTGGMYATPTFAGSRPSALAGCAWASLVTIGLDGYRKRTEQILQASRLIADGVQKEIPELYVLGQKEQTMVVCLGSDQVDIYRVLDAMTSRGWSLNSLQNPPSIHVCVTLAISHKAQDLVNDLKEAVAEVKKEDPSNSKKGTAGVYGMSGSIPEGPVNDFLKAFLDIALSA